MQHVASCVLHAAFRLLSMMLKERAWKGRSICSLLDNSQGAVIRYI